jgi:hypothetical protein
VRPPWSQFLTQYRPADFQALDVKAMSLTLEKITVSGFGKPCRVWIYMGNSARTTPDLKVDRIEAWHISDEDESSLAFIRQLEHGAPDATFSRLW